MYDENMLYFSFHIPWIKFFYLCVNFDRIYNFSNAAHPWLRSESHPIPLDIFIYKLVKSYIHATPFKRAALKVKIICLI